MDLSVDQLHFLTLHVGFAQHDGDWNWKNVRSPFARLYYVTDGEAQIAIGSDYHRLTPNHLYFIPAFTEHSYVCKASFSHYYIHIYEDQQHQMGILDQFTFPVEVDSSPIDLGLIKRLCDINPFLKLADSNPQAYDNHPTLISNIRLNQQRQFHDKMESRGILYILMYIFPTAHILFVVGAFGQYAFDVDRVLVEVGWSDVKVVVSTNQKAVWHVGVGNGVKHCVCDVVLFVEVLTVAVRNMLDGGGVYPVGLDA